MFQVVLKRGKVWYLLIVTTAAILVSVPQYTKTYCMDFLQAFANYLSYKRDNNELLLFILKQLASDHLTFNRNRYGGDFDIVEVPEGEFVEKVKGDGSWGGMGCMASRNDVCAIKCIESFSL